VDKAAAANGNYFQPNELETANVQLEMEKLSLAGKTGNATKSV